MDQIDFGDDSQPVHVCDVDGANMLVDNQHVVSGATDDLELIARNMSKHFPGYVNLRTIYLANQIYVFKAQDIIRDLKVTIKACLDADHQEASARLRHEWNCQTIFGEIGGINIPRSLEACNDNKGLMLVFPDDGDRSCCDYFNRSISMVHFTNPPALPNLGPSGIDLGRFLEFAIQVVQLLDNLHQRGITHGNINPVSIGVDGEDRAKLFDMSCSTFLEREDAQTHELAARQLPFMSPESSGRINRSVDYRSDFYSLGVCFYLVLTGRCPFTSDNALDLIYHHIAHTPIPPHEVCPDIPLCLSAIVSKLMAKTAEDRYQTDQGLVADLLMVQDFSATNDLHDLDSFVPGLTDAASQFSIPQKLFGRQDDIDSLLASFESVKTHGGGNVVIIKGSSGTGKSSLVNEINKPVLESRSFFASGKFDQYKRGVPFFSLLQAAGELVRQSVSESTIQIEDWKAEILRALGSDAAAILEVLPEVRNLYGVDFIPPVMAELGPAEREQRFTDAFLRFILVFAKRGSPLVLFLDDIQWSSVVEMNLIAALAIAGSESKHHSLSLIVAYRDNEVPDGHHVLSVLRRLTDARVSISVIEVKSMSLAAVREMVSATLRWPCDKTNGELETLTRLILAKTEGNAFFITQILKRLKDNNQIFYDFPESKWKFDLASILREDLPITVIDLLLLQLQQLGRRTQNCLHMAACLGNNRFSYRLLAIVSDQRLRITGKDLWTALQSGLLIPTSSSYKATADYRNKDTPAEDMEIDQDNSVSEGSIWEEDDSSYDATYRFLHDRVQQASYQLVPESERPSVHLAIGLRLFAYYKQNNQIENNIFEVVNQINRGLTLVKEDQLPLVIELNLRAGKKALRSTAFDAAMQYLSIAKSHAPEAWWNEQFSLSMEINLAHVDATYAVHDYSEAASNLQRLTERAHTPMEKARIMYRLIDVYMGLDKLHDAIDIGLQAMQLLGVAVPQTAQAAAAFMREKRSKLDLSLEQIDSIASMEITADPKVLLLQSLATSVLLPLYLSMPDLLQAVCGAVVLFMLEHGVSEAGAYPLIMYGVTITHGAPSTRTRQQGYHLGLAAVKIVNNTSAQTLTATTPKVLKVFASHICYWNEPPRACLVYFNSAMATGNRTFNIEYTCYAYVESCSYAFWSGEPLTTVVQRMSQYLPLIRKFKLKQCIWYCSIQLQSYVNLMSDKLDPSEIDGEHFSMACEYDALIATDSHPQIFVVYLAKLLVAVYFHRPDEVVFGLLTAMDQYAAGTLGTVYIAGYTFLICSALVSHLPTLSAEYHAMFYEYYSKLRFFQSGSPTSFNHKVMFIEAELLRNEDNDLHALDKFESAYGLALETGNIHEAGHIAERTYLWLETKSKNLARRYLMKSYDCFRLAGFKSKTRDMKTRYPDVLTAEALKIHVPDQMKPFRNVQMQISPDGTLSKTTPLEQGLQSPMLSLVDANAGEQDQDETESIGQAKTDITSNTRNSATGSLRLKTMPPRTFSHRSQLSFSPREDELTPTGTMSSFISRSKIGSFRTQHTSRQSQDNSTNSGSKVTSQPTVEGSKDFDLDVALKASVMISDVLQVSEVLQRLIESVLKNAGADYGALLLVEKGNLYVEATGRNDSVMIVSHQLLGMNSEVVPFSLVNYVARLRETIVLGSGENRAFQSGFGKDPYFSGKRLRSIMCMPVQNSVKLIGVLYLENSSTAYTFGPRRVELLNFLCTQAAIAIEKARLYSELGVARDEAQASNRMKSEFLSTISHEIRTPFNAVLGMSGFLLDTQLSPMQIDYVETIRNSSKELLRVIDDILDFSKMEHGTFELHKEGFSLRECIEGAMQITAERAASKELELAYFNCHSDYPDILINDTTRFRQVVINLLGNSIKFTEKGSVTLSSNATLIRPAVGGENAVYRIQVSVRDTGIGIKEEDHKKLFKLFSQIDSSLARNFSGTGLGLAISEKLVRLMGGQIWVESKAGVGSTFHFTIVTEANSNPVLPHPLVPKLQGLGVLILDDNEVATQSLSESLEWLGMRVLVTRNVEECTNAIANNAAGSFRLALIDLHYGLADAIVSELARYDPACKILRLSRFGFRQKFNDKYEYLIKPVKRERLARVVAETIHPDLREVKTSVVEDGAKFNPVGMATKHPLRILLAEDNLINSRVALQHLKRMGYSAVHAKDGQYCLEEEDKAIYDVILMDVQMPRLDGCQAASKIRAKYLKDPERCPRIIAMTANAMRGDMERCLEAGMHAYCQKPIIVDVLAQRLREATKRPE